MTTYKRRTRACKALRPITLESRATSDESRQQQPCCAACLWAATMRDGKRTLPICANTPDAPGEIVRVRPHNCCPNFRRKRDPVVRATPPDPPDDSIRFIQLTKGKFAIVDKSDYEWLNRYKWCVTGTDRPYACRREANRTIYMHREIMRPPKGMCVDHIKGFTLDNRRANLRICTHTENMRNRHGNSGRTLFKGVTFQAHCARYKASIGTKGRPMHIGYYDNPIDAAKAYDRKALELFGEFARLNFPDAPRLERVTQTSPLASQISGDVRGTEDKQKE